MKTLQKIYSIGLLLLFCICTVHYAYSQEIRVVPPPPKIEREPGSVKGLRQAEQDLTNPERAFDSETGQNLHWDCHKKTWVDSKTGKALGFQGALTKNGEVIPPPPVIEREPGSSKGLRQAEQDKSDPKHAFDSETGQNLHWDSEQKIWKDSKTGKALGFQGAKVKKDCPPPKPKVHLGAMIGFNYDMFAIHDDQQNKNSTGNGIGGLIGAFAVYPLSELFSLEATLDYAINTPTFTNDESQSDQFGTTQYHSETGWGFHGFDLGVGPQFHLGGIDIFAGLKINFTTGLSLSNTSTISRDGQQLASIDTTFSMESDKYNTVVPYLYTGLQYRINMQGLPFDITPSLAINIPMSDNTPSTTFGGSNKLTIVGLVVKLTWKQDDI